ncbi:MAG: hypothetical protein U0V75_17535 [Ferruginibacter sp.]
MNTTHLHLLLNHFPIIGTLIGSTLLLWGILRREQQLKSAGAFILVAMAAISFPVYLTGEPAEETVEDLPGVSEKMISLHEHAATLATWLLAVTGLLSVTAIAASIKKSTRTGLLFTIACIASVLSFAAMARTGYYGGQIRHTELNGTSASPAGEKSKDAGEGSKQKEKDDDD